jgi:outer membrane protein assembly factor BamB
MRRREFIGSLAGALLLPRLAWAQKAAAAPADAWPHFRGTAGLTGVSSSAVPAALKRQWVWESGPDVPVDSSPAIVGGVVYVGTAAGELVALGLDDGKLRWRYKAGESIGESSPAVAAGRVFIGDLDGSLHAVNATDGKRLWSYKTQSEIKCSPLVVGDVVLIGSYDARGR